MAAICGIDVDVQGTVPSPAQMAQMESLVPPPFSCLLRLLGLRRGELLIDVAPSLSSLVGPGCSSLSLWAGAVLGML